MNPPNPKTLREEVELLWSIWAGAADRYRDTAASQPQGSTERHISSLKQRAHEKGASELRSILDRTRE